MDDVFEPILPFWRGHDYPLKRDTDPLGQYDTANDAAATPIYEGLPVDPHGKGGKARQRETGLTPLDSTRSIEPLPPGQSRLRHTVDNDQDVSIMSSLTSSDSFYIKGNQHTATPTRFLTMNPSKLPSVSLPPFISSVIGLFTSAPTPALPKPSTMPASSATVSAIVASTPPLPTIPSLRTIPPYSSIPTAIVIPTGSIPTASTTMPNVSSIISISHSSLSTALPRSSKSSPLPSTTQSPTSTIHPFKPQDTPTLVNVNDAASAQSAPSYTVPIVVGVLSGLFLVSLLAFAVYKMKQKRKQRQSWAMHQETPWRDPFRASLDQYHSHY
ncbi:unnamed protein product [Umbelopsis vinacea]